MDVAGESQDRHLWPQVAVPVLLGASPSPPFKPNNEVENRMATKNKMIKIRVTENEEKQYKKAAEEAGISVSELIRRTMEDNPPIVIPGGLEEFRKAFSTVTRIGNYQKKLDKAIHTAQDRIDVSSAAKQQAIDIARQKLIESRQNLTPEIIKLKGVLLAILERIN